MAVLEAELDLVRESGDLLQELLRLPAEHAFLAFEAVRQDEPACFLGEMKEGDLALELGVEFLFRRLADFGIKNFHDDSPFRRVSYIF